MSKICFKENIKAIKANEQNPKYAQHILDKGHKYGTVNKTLEILHIEKKGHLINTLEIFHIHLSMALQSFVGPWSLFQSLNPIHSR
jgi:hypothetical protein